jgi:small subunit ribosomal protein S1
MSWSKKVRKPADVVKPGDLVEVIVLGVNAAERRISLGLKQALGDPWEEAGKKFPAGTVVEGPVRSLTNFGAFVELGDVEGMIHIGDISREKRLNHPREMLATGQVVKAVVLEMDREKRRIRLGMKQLEPTTVDEFIAEHKEGEVVTGRLVEVRKDRARVELGEGVLADCRIQAEAGEIPAPAQAPPSDLSSLTAMLSAKWKQGKEAAAGPARREPARAGQVRSFRILALDAGQKRIEVELAG